jgi:hypothetical protein
MALCLVNNWVLALIIHVYIPRYVFKEPERPKPRTIVCMRERGGPEACAGIPVQSTSGQVARAAMCDFPLEFHFLEQTGVQTRLRSCPEDHVCFGVQVHLAVEFWMTAFARCV